MRKASGHLPHCAPRIIALTGFMAVGKSTVGRALASHLQWPVIDLDSEIERRSKLRIHEIFATRGESRFRELESDALRHAMEHSGPVVIALGGGTFVQPSNAALLRDHGAHVIFLEVGVEELLERCRAGERRSSHNPRPLAADAEAFCALYYHRLPYYQKADMTVSTAGKMPEEIAREIAAALGLSASTSAGRS